MRRSSHHFGLLEGHGREVEPVLHLSEVLLDQALDARPHRDLRTAPKDFRRNLVVLVQGLRGYGSPEINCHFVTRVFKIIEKK